MVIGFTGTRKGITEYQFNRLMERLGDIMDNAKEGEIVEFHHGDCVGADAQAAEMAHSVGMRIVSHPPFLSVRRAYAHSDETLPVKGYKARNRDIVNVCDILLACPEGCETMRSGTWYTIRIAYRTNKSIVIFMPMEDEGTV